MSLKVVVWDLDNTLWQGTLTEGGGQQLRPGIRRVVRQLDESGVLQSVASKNDLSQAMRALHRLGIAEYFLYPQISWDNKSAAIAEISSRLGLSVDTFAFVDDTAFERAEVASVHPAVWCLDEHSAALWPTWRAVLLHASAEGAQRRAFYRAEQQRREALRAWAGTSEEFLLHAEMTFTIRHATQTDNLRLIELSQRARQFNSDPQAFPSGHIDKLIASPHHLVLLGQLTDRFGEYGTVSAAITTVSDAGWAISQYMLSCRALGRGVEALLLDHLHRLAVQADVTLTAHYRQTEHNTMLKTTLLRHQFRPAGQLDQVEVLICAPVPPAPGPTFVRLVLPEPETSRR